MCDVHVPTACRYFDGLNCQSLIGKPKVFIIQVSSGSDCGGWVLTELSLQACRGGKFDYGVDSETTDGPVDMGSKEVWLPDPVAYMADVTQVQWVMKGQSYVWGCVGVCTV